MRDYFINGSPGFGIKTSDYENFLSLRQDQRNYVHHLMLSWGCDYYDFILSSRLLRHAIKKARNNLP